MNSWFSLLSRVWTHPANTNSAAAIGRLLRWQCYKRLGAKQLPFRYHGFVLPAELNSHSASAAYYFNGLPDYREMRFLQDYLRPGDRVLDVGANIGIYTLLAARLVGSTGHVDSFEPNPPTRERLQQAITFNQLQQLVTIHQSAASDSEGEIEFGYADDDCMVRMRGCHDADNNGFRVPTIRLDTHFGEHSYALAKLDIEGGEPLAIRGAESMLRQGNPPVMLIEMAGYSQRFNVSTPQLIQQLADLGYRCGIYDPQTRQINDTKTPWLDGVENVLAVCDQRRDAVTARLKSTSEPTAVSR